MFPMAWDQSSAVRNVGYITIFRRDRVTSYKFTAPISIPFSIGKQDESKAITCFLEINMKFRITTK